jgi:hypothetical protein
LITDDEDNCSDLEESNLALMALADEVNSDNSSDEEDINIDLIIEKYEALVAQHRKTKKE